MNYLPFVILPSFSAWNSVQGLHFHPDIKDEAHVSLIDDLRDNYLPATSYGSRYLPFVKPVIATMPGLDHLPQAKEFFRKREVYLIGSHRLTWNLVTLTACSVTAFFLAHFSLIAAAGTLFIYMVLARIIQAHYETKADVSVLEQASKEQLSEALGLIFALEEKAKTNEAVRTFRDLKAKIEAKGIQPAVVPLDLFDQYEEHGSSLGLPYKMRPSIGQMQNEEVKKLSFKREAFHLSVENSDLLKMAAAIGFVTVTTTVVSSAFFVTPWVYLAAGVYSWGFYSLTHQIGDQIFKWKHDPTNVIGADRVSHPDLYKGVYRGAY